MRKHIRYTTVVFLLAISSSSFPARWFCTDYACQLFSSKERRRSYISYSHPFFFVCVCRQKKEEGKMLIWR